MSDFQVSPELLAIYLEDARQHLEALDHCLLTLEREGADAETVAAVLGPLHTLKGNSGMIGFHAIKDYLHRLEDVFARVRDGALALDPEAFDHLFAGATALRDAIEQAGREGTEGARPRPGASAARADEPRLPPGSRRRRAARRLPPRSSRRRRAAWSSPRRPRPWSGARTPATRPGPASCAWSSRSSTTCSTSWAS